MKFLVDDATSAIRGSFEFPLDSSVAGFFVVDVPSNLGVATVTNSLTDLINAKIAAYQAVYPDLIGFLNDEFLTAGGVDTGALSNGYSTGVNKRVALLPGGHFQTPVLTITGSFTQLFFHLSLFTLFRESPGISDAYPGPSRQLYGFDPGISGFAEPSPSLVQASVMDSTGAVELLAMTSDLNHSFSQTGPFSFRMRFTNTSLTKVLYLSDWLLLHN